jgi:hypothetical protein
MMLLPGVVTRWSGLNLLPLLLLLLLLLATSLLRQLRPLQQQQQQPLAVCHTAASGAAAAAPLHMQQLLWQAPVLNLPLHCCSGVQQQQCLQQRLRLVLASMPLQLPPGGCCTVAAAWHRQVG